MSQKTAAQAKKVVVAVPDAAETVAERDTAAVKKAAPKSPATRKATPQPKVSPKPVKKAAPAAKSKVAEAPKAEKAVKATKEATKKPKLVRDSFTLPEGDYALFATLKQRALAAGIEVKKSELLRASLTLLANLADGEFAKVIGSVERIKTGRPKK